MIDARKPIRPRCLLPIVLTIASYAPEPSLAADFPAIADAPYQAPRFFPRSEDTTVFDQRTSPTVRRYAACQPRQVPIPTDAPDDPSYVGSPYGLGKPSYYGFRPALGHDDPSSRPIQYCP